jgi:hypothetical protein
MSLDLLSSAVGLGLGVLGTAVVVSLGRRGHRGTPPEAATPVAEPSTSAPTVAEPRLTASTVAEPHVEAPRLAPPPLPPPLPFATAPALPPAPPEPAPPEPAPPVLPPVDPRHDQAASEVHAATEDCERLARELAAMRLASERLDSELRGARARETEARLDAEALCDRVSALTSDLDARAAERVDAEAALARLARAEEQLSAERTRAAGLELEAAELTSERTRARKLSGQLRQAMAALGTQRRSHGSLEHHSLDRPAEIPLHELNQHVLALGGSAGVRSVAVADLAGRTVAASNADGRAVAALGAGLARSVAHTAPWLATRLSLGEFELIHVQDSYGGSLTVRRLAAAPAPLVLAVLSTVNGTAGHRLPAAIAPATAVVQRLRPEATKFPRKPTLTPA